MTFSSMILKVLAAHKCLRSNPLFSQVILKMLNITEINTLFSILLKKKITFSDDLDRNALRTLNSLNLLTIENDCISLDEIFRTGFLESLGLVGSQEYFLASQKKYDCFLDLNKNDNFNLILSILVNPKKQKEKDSDQNQLIRSILKFSNLTDSNITHEGFSFLLKSRREQVWYFLLAGIDQIVENNTDFKLFFLVLLFDMGNYGKNSIKLNLSHKETRSMIDEKKLETSVIESFFELLETIGILSHERNFYFRITSVYYSLFNSNQSVERFLILETNYKLYSTDVSDHTKSVLSLFSNIISVLPNLIVCHIDEGSINRSLSRGITGKQICDYISNRSRRSVNSIVLEQIMILEMNKNRIKNTNAILYDHFGSFQEFQMIQTYCNEFLLCCDKERRIIVVREEDHNRVKGFIKENIKR